VTAEVAEAKWQAGQTPQAEIRAPDQSCGLEDPMRQPAQHQLKGNLTFDPRQRRAKAEVRRPPEGKMPGCQRG